MAWCAVSLASLVGLNGIVHVLATLGFGVYSPGAATGLLIYIPLSLVVLRSSSTRLPNAVYWAALIGGIVAHIMVTLTAIS